MLRLLLPLLLVLAAPPPGEPPRVVAADPAAEHRVADVTPRVLDARKRMLPHFPGVSGDDILVVLHSSEAAMSEEQRARLDPGTQGYALRGRGEIHLLLDTARRPPPHDLQTVIDHELVHVLLDRFAGDAGPHVSRWFHEGLAEMLSGEAYLGASEEEIVWRAIGDRLLRFRDLHEGFPHEPDELRTAYAQSLSFVAFLAHEVGLPVLIRAARHCRADRTYAEAFTFETGVSIGGYEERWREYVRTGSGAGMRVILQNCFGLLLVIALPLLVLAGMRKWRAEHASRARLDELERAEQESWEPPGDPRDPARGRDSELER